MVNADDRITDSHKGFEINNGKFRPKNDKLEPKKHRQPTYKAYYIGAYNIQVAY